MTEGPGYWDVNENSAGHVHQPRHGGHWRETIRRESPPGAMQRLAERSAELSREASAPGGTPSCAPGGTPSS
jgi:hypothetical protein